MKMRWFALGVSIAAVILPGGGAFALLVWLIGHRHAMLGAYRRLREHNRAQALSP